MAEQWWSKVAYSLAPQKGEKLKVKLDKDGFMPERAHDTDAGIDLRATRGQRIMPHSSAVFNTGICIELPKGTCGVVMSKSGLNFDHDLTTTGLIDESYRGEIKVKLYNHGADSYLVAAGDKVAQLVIVPCLYEPLEFVEELDMNTDRGEDGFGSTGR